MIENFTAFFKKDYRRIAELHVECGWLLSDKDLNDFESSIRAICEPIFEMPLYKIPVSKILMSLFEVSKEFNIQIQPQLILLQKTLLNIESLSRSLYPNLNIWKVSRKFFEGWMYRKINYKKFIKSSTKNFYQANQALVQIPSLLSKILQREKNLVDMKKKKIDLKLVLVGFSLGVLLIIYTK